MMSAFGRSIHLDLLDTPADSNDQLLHYKNQRHLIDNNSCMMNTNTNNCVKSNSYNMENSFNTSAFSNRELHNNITDADCNKNSFNTSAFSSRELNSNSTDADSNSCNGNKGFNTYYNIVNNDISINSNNGTCTASVDSRMRYECNSVYANDQVTTNDSNCRLESTSSNANQIYQPHNIYVAHENQMLEQSFGINYGKQNYRTDVCGPFNTNFENLEQGNIGISNGFSKTDTVSNIFTAYPSEQCQLEEYKGRSVSTSSTSSICEEDENVLQRKSVTNKYCPYSKQTDHRSAQQFGFENNSGNNDNVYNDKRKKNNEASRRSRLTRRLKECMLLEELKKLKKENENLKAQISFYANL